MSLNKIECVIGETRFDVYSDHVFLNLFSREFKAQISGIEPEVEFYISRPNAEEVKAIDAHWSQAGGTSGETVPFSSPIADFKIRLGCPARVHISVKRTAKMKAGRALPRQLQRIFTARYMTADEQEYVHVLYDSILWIVFLIGLRAGRIFLHASGVEYNDMTVLLCGAGGVGKTTLSRCFLSGLLDGKVGFISDDLVQVGEKGVVAPNMMFAHLYPYNTGGSTALADSTVFQNSRVNRLHWDLRTRFFGEKSVCRRLDPRELYPKASFDQRSRDLSRIIWLAKSGDHQDLTQEHVAPAFASNHLQVLHKELRNAFHFYDQAREMGFDFETVGLPKDLDEAVESALHKLCEQVPVVIFCPDKNKAPMENARRLAKEFIW